MLALQGNKAHVRGRLLLIAAVLAWPAMDAFAVDCGGALGLGSDNVSRGISLGGADPSWILDGHCRVGDGWIAGAGASRVHLAGRRPGAQLSLYVDRNWQFDDDWRGKVGIVHYDGARRGRLDGLRYDEINAAVGSKGFWRASLAFSPNASDLYFTNALAPISDGAGKSHWAAWAETTFHQPVSGRLAADAGFGLSVPGGKGESSYRYGSIGLSYSIADVNFYATRIWTDAISWQYDYLGSTFVMRLPSRAEWVGTIIWTF